jgi:hypothetical protein
MMRLSLLVTLSATVLAGPVAAQVSPHGTFGAIPEAHFNGSGIPNDAMMIDSFDGVTIGLTATQRYSNNPVVTNDGAGTYYAAVGGDLLNADPGYARWNFNWFIGGATAFNYNYQLLYDFDPAAGNAGHGALESIWLTILPQDSYNLGFGFLGTTFPGLFTAPGFGPFDPAAHGSYTFALQQFDANFNLVGSVGMEVIVGSGATSTVPEPATMTLLATGLAGLVGARRRKLQG